MQARRSVAGGAAGLLAVLLLARNSPSELARRLEFLDRFSPRELAVRRLGGSSAAFDRSFFRFVESAHRTLPPACPGVGLYAPTPDPQQLYLASYVLAPVPVRLVPPSLPPGWVAAIYGSARPAGWILVRALPGGSLMKPPARPL